MYQYADSPKGVLDVRIIVPEILRDVALLHQYGEISTEQRRLLSKECSNFLTTKDPVALKKTLEFVKRGVSFKEKIEKIIEKLAAVSAAEGEKNG